MAAGKRFGADSRKIIEQARQRYTYALAVDKDDRDAAVDDVKFAAGEQWAKEAVDARTKANRPVLTENRLPTYLAQVVNDGRQSKPSIHLTALDGGNKDTAEMLQGHIRHIEYESNAEIAYDTSREHQVTSGRGFYRVNTRYKPGSFEQEIRIERIENQFSVLFDPDAKEYDRSDADYGFVLTTKSKDAFKRDFGADSNLVRNSFYVDQENPAPEWVGVGPDGGSVQVAEYWVREHNTRTLCAIEHELSPGMTVRGVAYRDELPDDFPKEAILESREEDVCTVKQYIIDGVEIHEETDWLGSYIPIVPMWGKELVVDGRRRTFSLIRFAKDPQRLVNLYVSNIAEQIAMMPKTPWIGAEGQFNGHEDEWANVNNSPLGYIQYRPVVLTVNGQQIAAPPPSRNVVEPPIQALTIGLNQAIDAIKASMGIFDASLGARSNETSGLAIEKRKREADNANYHFHDNEARSRKHAGRIILELLPIVHQGEKTLPTRTEDGKTKLAKVNTAAPYTDEDGKQVHHQLDQGEYGVAISTGPSYTSARQEAFDLYSQIAGADKNFMQVAGDILFRNMDAPGSDQIADRYEQGVIPPQLRPQKGGQQPIPPEAQQKIALLTQELQAAHQFAQSLHEQIQSKSVEQQTKLEITAMQEETKRTVALAQIQAQDGIALLEQEIASLRSQYDQVHQAQQSALSQAHERDMAERQHQQQLEQGDQQHQQALQQQQAAHGNALDQQQQAADLAPEPAAPGEKAA